MDERDGARLPGRRSMRLAGFDYGSSAGYVVTICADGRRAIFGVVREGVVELTGLGEIVRREWLRTAEMRPGVLLDEFVVMPNHFHGIVILNEVEGGVRGDVGRAGPARTVSAIVRGFKAACSSRARKAGVHVEFPIWQSGFHDRVIRDDGELEKFRRYIVDNPRRWEADRFHVGSSGVQR